MSNHNRSNPAVAAPAPAPAVAPAVTPQAAAAETAPISSTSNDTPSATPEVTPAMIDEHNPAAPVAPKRSAKVVVGCKLPAGLTIAPGVTLNGSAHHTARVGGFGLTTVDRDVWDEFVSTHDHEDADRAFLPLKNGLVFAQKSHDDAVAEAAEKAGEKNGFEGIDPDNPGEGIEETEESRKARKEGAA